jgi:hypothetical protein
MDAYDRLVYSAFGVADVINPENQIAAASAALVRGLELELDNGRLQVGTIYIRQAVAKLRSREFDSLIGNFPAPETQHDLETAIISAADRMVLDTAPGVSPDDLMRISTAVVAKVIAWAQCRPDALRDAAMSPGVSSTPEG